MTMVREIAGLAPDSQTGAGAIEEMQQRAKLVKPRPMIDTAILSEGELTVELMRQRYAMLADYLPERPGFRKAAVMAENALYQGLHTGPGVGAWSKILDRDQKEVAWAIVEGKSKTNPASGWTAWDEKPRTPATATVPVGAIPLLNCDALYPNIDQNQYPGQGWVQQENANRAVKRVACATENKWRAALNERWEKASLAYLYEFIGPVSNDNPYLVGAPVAAAKAFLHQDFVDGVTDASLISRANLRIWAENGNIANSIAAGLGPQTGIEFIDGLRDNAAIEGFPAVLVKIAIGSIKSTWNQFQLFMSTIKGDITLKEAVAAHIDYVEGWFKQYEKDLDVLAANSDFKIPKPGEPGEEDGGDGGDDDGDGKEKDKTMLYVGLGAAALLLLGGK